MVYTAVVAEGCDFGDWLKCGTKVATCAAKCYKKIASLSCISCLGGSYQQCKDCVGLEVALQQG